jgi:hypothetical protein
MARGLIRYEDAESFHFLTFSCYHRFQYLGAAEACDRFEDAWSGRVSVTVSWLLFGVTPDFFTGKPRDAESNLDDFGAS